MAGVINFCDKVKQTQLTIEARYGKRPVEVFQPETEEEVEELEVEEQEEEEEIAIPDNMDLLLTANGETVYEIKYMNEGGEEQTTPGNELEDLIIDLKASESRTRRSRTKVEPEVEEQMELDQEPSTETTPTRSTRRAKTGKQSQVEEESGSSSPSSDVVNKLMKDYGVLTCKLCPQEKTLQDFRKMKNHNSSEHDLEGVACCEKVFHSRVRLYEHVKYHVAPGDIKCETCHKHFKSQANLKTHMADHHADTMFGCTTCEFLCASDKILKRHQLSHLPVSDRSVACPLCDFRCHFASQLTTHTKAKHPDPSAKRDGPEHVCEECHKSFSTKGNLTSHIKALHDLNTSKVECGQCGKMVRRLARHLSICQNKQQLKCPHCPNIHPNQHALNTHILRMHKKDLSKLTCEVCNKVLSRESHLRVSSGENLIVVSNLVPYPGIQNSKSEKF